jgi:hypothetical protein
MLEWLCQTNKSQGIWRPEPESTMENLNVINTTNTANGIFTDFARDLMALGDKPSQLALEPVLAGRTLADVIALDNAGTKLAGSAERATAAMINVLMRDHTATATDEDGVLFHWSQVEYRDKSPLAKALKPHKDACFAAWSGHSNPSTKWARVRAYGYELDHPKVNQSDLAANGEEGEEGEGAGTTSRTRDLYERCVVELAKLYRALNSAENDAVIKAHAEREKLTDALVEITAALSALGAPLEDDELVQFVKSVSK